MKKIGALLLVVTSLSSCQTQSVSRHPSSTDGMDQMGGMPMGAEAGPAPVCTSFSDTISPAQQAVINAVVAGRAHRLQHALWHATRAGLSTKEESSVVHAFGEIWGTVKNPDPTQFHPMCPAPQKDSTAATYNPAGEDFLYMHRTMVNMIRTALLAKNLPCISGWTHVPTPTEWALPDSDTTGPKSDSSLAQLTAWDSTFQDPKWLSSVSLSQVGWALEITVHNNLHMRYATTQPPSGFPNIEKTGGAPIPYNGKFPAGWLYDQPNYSWLADPYGAAVNSTFWKIHGYVDHLIDAWLKANNYDEVASNCAGAKDRCYQWKGTWTGEIPSSVAIAKMGAREGAEEDTAPEPTDRDTISFNRKRMRSQHIGVLEGDDSTDDRPGMDKVAPPQDPLQFTESRLCSPSK